VGQIARRTSYCSFLVEVSVRFSTLIVFTWNRSFLE
jgi:hypothetical protein